MRYVGIDIASEEHWVAIIDGDENLLVKATRFTEDATGYEKLRLLLGAASDTLVAMEATGHYWKNLFASLVTQGFCVAVINPLRTRRFAEEDLARTKTDAIDALGIARFAAQKKPMDTRISDAATDELRELVRHRDRLVQQMGDHIRQLHRLVDLGFPEFTRFVTDLGGPLATMLLARCPTARSFAAEKPKRLAKQIYAGRNQVGDELAGSLIETAKVSVGAHHGEVYKLQVRHACEDIETLRQRIKAVADNIEGQLDKHEVGKLLTSIDGIGPQTAARLIAELGNPAEEFRDAAALAAYVGVVPGTNLSGKAKNRRFAIGTIGHAALRAKLWMPTLTAVRKNPWLRAHYQRWRAAGKLPKVALIAAMHKLLAAIYSVAKHKRPFVPILPAPIKATV